MDIIVSIYNWLLSPVGLGYMALAIIPIVLVCSPLWEVPSVLYLPGFAFIFASGILGLGEQHPTRPLMIGVLLLMLAFLFRFWHGKVHPWASKWIKGRRERIRA